MPGVPLKKHRSASFLAEHQVPVPDLGDHPARRGGEASQALHVLATATHKSFIDVCSKLIAMRSARHAS